jgi:cytidylate kinase
MPLVARMRALCRDSGLCERLNSVRRPPSVVVIYGPKGAGKSWVADELRRRAGVAHVDADRVVLDLLDRGQRPDRRLGWLEPVETEVRRAVGDHAVVSVEATGAWDSDWLLADRLAAAGYRVLRVWVTAPLEVTLDRVAHRLSRKVPVTADEARWIHNEATRRASARSFAAVIETSGLPDTSRLDRLLESLR